ncbi:YpfB family protein [Mesobacillus jeotgali]|uniref:YpfB family protein n=2 Tax=Mesobacillus jeotgali TaxID=129985 RepID=UPI002D7A127D|nr:YpfB family protein [Mesobacillus jeotgali]
MMKTIERILIKIAIIQFIFLVIAQVFFHEFNAFPELKQITQYEGVTDNNHSEVLNSFRSKE